MKQKLLAFLLLICLLTSCNPIQENLGIRGENFPLTQRWSSHLDGRIYGLAVSDDWIAVSQSNGITAIDTETGSYLWNLSFPLDKDSLLLFLNGNLVVASFSQMKVIDKSGEELSTINFHSQNESPQIVAAYSNYVFVRMTPSWKLEIYDIQRGTLAWEIPVGRGGLSISFDEITNIVYLTTTSFVSSHDISNGSMIWKIDKNTRTGIFDAGVIYYSSESSGNENAGNISAVDARSLDLLWDANIPNGVRTAIYNLTVIDNMLIVSTDFGLLAIDKKDGHDLWQSETSEFFYGKPVFINDVIYVRGTTTSVIYAISPTNGRYLGYLHLENSSILSTPQREYDIIYKTDRLLIFPFENTVYTYQIK